MKGYFLSALALLMLPQIVQAQTPDYYPPEYAALIEAANAEGRVVVYGTPDPYVYEPLVAAFEELYPEITVEFNSMSSVPMYSRVISEIAAGAATADVIWSPAMDLQAHLAHEGYAETYASPELSQIPEWAVWNNQLYAPTIAPTIFVYNRSLLTPEQVPQNHSELPALLQENADAYRNRIVVYDIERSGIGFQFLVEDYRQLDEDLWEIHSTFESLGARLGSGTSNIIESVASGEYAFAYNMNGDFIGPIADANPDLGYVLPEDYTIVVLNIALISTSAANPNAAKLWLDFMLSDRGQGILQDESNFTVVRSERTGRYSANELLAELGDSFLPIGMGPELLEFFVPERRVELLNNWKQSFRGDQ